MIPAYLGRPRSAWPSLILPLLLLGSALANAQDGETDLTKLKIEDLMKVEVTSVSKHEQSLSETAAAVFVISSEDIRRSGATDIPDVLRMVPGVYVAQINASTWAICIRGLNGRFSNELLVLVDGRTVYTRTFGGVIWNTLDFPIEDIDRIEVIRGPGGSVWGENAVNGVINITTRKAADMQGVRLDVLGGNLSQGLGSASYGGKIGGAVDYRMYVRFLNEGSYDGLAGEHGADSWRMLRSGLRVDARPSVSDTLSVQADIYSGRVHQPTEYLPSPFSPTPLPVNTQANQGGGFVQGTWEHSFSSGSHTKFLGAYQQYEDTESLNETRDTVDLDFQHNLAIGERQEIVWGLNYRYTDSRSIGSTQVSVYPANRDTNLFGGFFQYQIGLADRRVILTGGLKIEHDPYVGFETMPTGRVAWRATENNTLWASVSRAVRTPSDIDTGVRYNEGAFPGPGGVPVVVSVFGNPNIFGESLIAYEAGYRASLLRNLSVDLALYYNDYRHQITEEPQPVFFENTPAPPHYVQPFRMENLMRGEAHGIEIFANWKIADRWSVAPGYAFEQIHLHLLPGSQDYSAIHDGGEDTPVNSVQFRNHLVVTSRLSWETSLYFNGALQSPAVDSYTRLDTGLIWHCTKSLTLSAFGQNLLQSNHLEFVDTTGSARSTLVPRSGYAKLSWRF